ncbi:DNA-protecting protein DprA [Amycolatopsis sp. K13G38]|uniref:DNA-protecting protein DprA n=1 Tax=Amycolatopsis acididurans TaxID=2724524 RepID=A0ABX1JDA5_9PSEU|nr:DNA-processing protein DprA [Amycolatopsis acididurans]NKQ56844.1 DNA-protecting protein DprA [Amycolatopsis acididurans]
MSALTEARIARAYLLRVAEPPAPALAAFVAEVGPVAAARAVRSGECPRRVADETAARREVDRTEQDFAAARKAGARLVTPEDDEWPAWPLLCLANAERRGVRSAATPLALWVRGDVRLDETTESAVAIVGARASTNYGETVAGELAYGLALRGHPIFSGAAYGIDGAAHRGALAAKGTTVALLGCGVDIGYPSGHVALLKHIANQGGLVISEYPPGTQPARHRFLVRNRLIAALSEGTVVVEAGRRSGARNTATTAGVLGKIVMAVPGPVDSAVSAGCHDLIRDAGSTLVASVDDIIETVGKLGSQVAEKARPKRATDGLGSDALRVHETLEKREGKAVERIADESGVPVPRVRAVLPALEMDGLAECCESGWRQRRVVRKLSTNVSEIARGAEVRQ